MADIRQRGGAAASTEIDVVFDEDEALLRRNMSVDQLNKLVSSVSSKPSADQEDSSAIKKMRTAEDVRNEFQLLEQPVHRTKLPASEKTEAELDAESWSTRAKGLLPILEWAPKYGRDCKYHAGSGEPFRENVRRDVLAGMVIGVMLVPQGMAYALLAGLPPIYGLYSSTWTLVAYMVTGTCRLLGPGVNAPISLLVADALSSVLMLDEGCEDNPDGADCKYFIEQSLLLCLMVGVLYLVMASAVCAVFLHARTRLMAPCMLFRVGAAGEKKSVVCRLPPNPPAGRRKPRHRHRVHARARALGFHDGRGRDHHHVEHQALLRHVGAARRRRAHVGLHHLARGRAERLDAAHGLLRVRRRPRLGRAFLDRYTLSLC